MPTTQFVENLRVSKDIFALLLGKIESIGAPTFRSTHLRSDLKLATFLRFLATGSYQQTVGNEVLSSTCKSSVYRIIAECLEFFENCTCPQWIKFSYPEEENNIKEAFFQSMGFPEIIGFVDGTHSRIKSPRHSRRHLYYNRKGYYSINAMVVCDHKTRIFYVDARHTGANHDAYVWEQSDLEPIFKTSFENGQRNTWIIGDDGYKLKSFLMTPFRKPSTAEERWYNTKHTSARNIAERCFGVLKDRFRCIIGSREFHYDPQKTTKIINACCALHNICIYYKCEDPVIEVEDNTHDDGEIELGEVELEAVSIRKNIALNL